MRGLDEKVFVYYQHHPQDFADDLEALDDLIGCLGNDRCRPMDELDGSLEGYSPTDMMALAFYSWDEQCKGPFDPGRDYFYWNGRNGLVSTNNRDYRSDHLVDDIVVKIVKNATHLQLSKGVQEMINGWSEMRNLNKELFDFYQNHPDDFADDLETLDRLNYYLGNERRRPMPELDDLFGYKSVSELLALGGHSHDEDGGQFDPSRKYFYLSNGVVSTDYRDYRESYLNENIVQDILDNINHMTLSKGAQEIINRR